MILMIDNYDSFTYNLVQYLGELQQEVIVYRNDAISLDEIRQLAPKAIVISPGPCTPNEAGISLSLVEAFAGELPMFGVCLGHQSIGQVYGARVVKARQVMHGKASDIHHQGKGVFAGLPSPFSAIRYHSLVIEDLPEALEVTAWTLDDQGEVDEIMGIRHRSNQVEGVQFHPESILSEHGHAMLTNFLNTIGHA